MRHPTSSLFNFKSTKALDILSAVKKENKLYVHILILFIIDVIDLKWKQYRLEGTNYILTYFLIQLLWRLLLGGNHVSPNFAFFESLARCEIKLV